VLSWFDISQFPFFDHPFALNTQAGHGKKGLPLAIWARAGRGKPSGFYYLTPDKSVAPVIDVPTDGDVYRFVAGGVVKGEPDESVLIAMNNTHLLHRAQSHQGPLLAHKLPVAFAKPIEFGFSGPNTYILGPVSHDRTVSMAVDPSNAYTVAVSGWTSVDDNTGPEGVWLTMDGGKTFGEITGNLQAATGVCEGRSECGKWRPSALLVLPSAKFKGTPVVLVGTVSGVYAAVASKKSAIVWSRLGGCTQLPMVLVAGLSYEPSSDTVVAATMGRGVYALHGTTAMVEKALF